MRWQDDTCAMHDCSEKRYDEDRVFCREHDQKKPLGNIPLWLVPEHSPQIAAERTIEISMPRTKGEATHFKFIAKVGGQPYASAGGSWEECVAYLELRLGVDE